MLIEVLFPEVCNLYGDLQNARYLDECSNTLSVMYTSLHDKPSFLTKDIGLVYMGSTTEKGLLLCLDALMPYKDAIREKIEAGQHMLFTGNALDILGTSISSDFAPSMEGLSIFPTKTTYTMMKRHNSFFLGKLDDMKVVGFKSQFGHTDYDGEQWPLFNVIKGVGRDGKSNLEGFHYRNLYATYLIGPLLLLNPPFTKYLLKELDQKPSLAFEEAAYASYEARCKEFALKSKNFLY